MQQTQQIQQMRRTQMVEIGGRRCFVRPPQKGLKPQAVIYWGIMAGEGEQVEELCRLLDERDAATSADAAPANAALPAATFSDTAPIDTALIDAAPIDAAPIDTAPIDAALIDAAPVDAAPVDATLIDAAPVDAALSAAAPIDTALPAASADRASYLLIAYEAEDWNRDFSPWPAPAVFGKEDFGGGGAETLNWLIRSAMPEVKTMYGITHGDGGIRHFLGGYSLSGLFSLWAFYERGCFDGVVSCSGSLWYPGWQAYATDKTAPAESLVYLSLGDKEEKTRNQVMAKVGDMTRWQYGQVRRDSNVTRSVLEWNAGGHFKEPTALMAKGFAWLRG